MDWVTVNTSEQRVLPEVDGFGRTLTLPLGQKSQGVFAATQTVQFAALAARFTGCPKRPLAKVMVPRQNRSQERSGPIVRPFHALFVPSCIGHSHT